MVGEGYDKAIELLGISRRNMIKSYFEWFGIDVGWDDPKIQYRNYLAENPLIFFVPGGGAGGGRWEELTFGGGAGINISGKKIGVLGDSLTQAYESTIRKCIENMGGIPVCKAGNTRPNSDPKLGCTLIGGASFTSYKLLDFGSVFNGCEHIITELGTNDIAGNSFSTSPLTSGMSAVNSKIQSSGLSVKVHALGIMPFAFSTPGFGRGMSFGGVINEAKSKGDEETAKTIQNAQSSQCSSLGWHYLDPHGLSVYNIWHDKSAIDAKGGSDGVHIPKRVGYEEWFTGILKLAFGPGGSNSPWTKEQLDQWRSEGTLEQNTSGKVKYEDGKYYNWVGGGTPGSNYDNGSQLDKDINYSGNISHNLQDYAPQGKNTSKSTMDSLVTTFNLATGHKITMHEKVKGAIQAAFVEIKNLGWFNVSCVSGYGYRRVNDGSGSSKLSNHSWGVAIDINFGSAGNPFFVGDSPRTGWNGNVPKRAFKRNKSGSYVSTYGGEYDKTKCIWTWDHPVVKIMANHGFGWGGSYGDTMHFSALNGR